MEDNENVTKKSFIVSCHHSSLTMAYLTHYTLNYTIILKISVAHVTSKGDDEHKMMRHTPYSPI